MNQCIIHSLSLSTVFLLSFTSTVFAQHDETGYQLSAEADKGYGYEPPEADYNYKQGFGDFPPSDIDERLNGQIVEYKEGNDSDEQPADEQASGGRTSAVPPAGQSESGGASVQAAPGQTPSPGAQGAYPPQPGSYYSQRAFPQRAFPQQGAPQQQYTYPQGTTAQSGMVQGGAGQSGPGRTAPVQGAAQPGTAAMVPQAAPPATGMQGQGAYQAYPQSAYPQAAYPPAAYPPAAYPPSAYPRYPGRTFGGPRGRSNSFAPWGGSGPDFGGSGPWDSRGSGFDMPWDSDRYSGNRGRRGPWGMDDWMDSDRGGFNFNP